VPPPLVVVVSPVVVPVFAVLGPPVSNAVLRALLNAPLPYVLNVLSPLNPPFTFPTVPENDVFGCVWLELVLSIVTLAPEVAERPVSLMISIGDVPLSLVRTSFSVWL